MDPLTLMVILMAAGTGAQVKGARDRMSYQRKAMNQNAELRDRNTKRAEDLYQENLAEYEGDPRDKARASAEKRVAEAESASDSSEYDPLRGELENAEGANQRSIAKLIGQELERGKGQIMAKALLDGYSDRAFEQQLRNVGRQGETGMLATYDQGYGNILNAKLNASQYVGRKWEVLGDLLNAAGMAAGMGAFGGGQQATVIDPTNPAHANMTNKFRMHKAATGGWP